MTRQTLCSQRHYSKAILRYVKERRDSVIAAQGKAGRQIKVMLSAFYELGKQCPSPIGQTSILHSGESQRLCRDQVHPTDDVYPAEKSNKSRGGRKNKFATPDLSTVKSGECHYCLNDRTLASELHVCVCVPENPR